jgi:hypothetical protein
MGIDFRNGIVNTAETRRRDDLSEIVPVEHPLVNTPSQPREGNVHSKREEGVYLSAWTVVDSGDKKTDEGGGGKKREGEKWRWQRFIVSDSRMVVCRRGEGRGRRIAT